MDDDDHSIPAHNTDDMAVWSIVTKAAKYTQTNTFIIQILTFSLLRIT